MRLSGNLETVISAALGVERVKGIRPWTALDLIAFLDESEGPGKPSDATVYRLLHRLDQQLELLTSTAGADPDDARSPGRPRRCYELTSTGEQAAQGAASWLSHSGVEWARAVAGTAT